MTGLALAPGTWVGLQDLSPDAAPFAATPAFVEAVTPLKTGQGLLRLDLIRALAPRGPARVSVTGRVAHHAADHMVLVPKGGAAVAVAKLTNAWLRQHCLRLWRRLERDPRTEFQHWTDKEDPQAVLAAFLGDAPARILVAPGDAAFGSRKPPMPLERGMMRFRRRFDAMDAWLIQRGSVPTQMEHKWFVVTTPTEAGGTILFRRSWTGLPIYRIEFSWEGDGLDTMWAIVNLRSADYTFGTREEEEGRLDRLIHNLLLTEPFDGGPSWGEEAEGAAHASWYGSPPAPAPQGVPASDPAPAAPAMSLEEARAILAEDDEEGPPLASFDLSDAAGCEGFLWALWRVGEPGLLVATAHVWSALAPPRAVRGTAIGLAAGVAGTGRKAIWAALDRFIQEAFEAGPTLFPQSADFDSPALWHEAVMAHFDGIAAAEAAVVARYAAILNGDPPAAAAPAPPPSAAIIQGPWRVAKPAARPLPWLNAWAEVARLLRRFVVGVRARLGQPSHAPWVEREALRLNALFLGRARAPTHRTGDWNRPERLGRALMGLFGLEGPPELAVREALVALANAVACTVTCHLGEDEADWGWRVEVEVEGLANALLGLPVDSDARDDALAPANRGPGVPAAN